MYDMYRWNQPEAAVDDSGRAAAPRRRAHRPARRSHHARAHAGVSVPGAAHAVQVALDRRDNGGDSGVAGGQ